MKLTKVHKNIFVESYKLMDSIENTLKKRTKDSVTFNNFKIIESRKDKFKFTIINTVNSKIVLDNVYLPRVLEYLFITISSERI